MKISKYYLAALMVGSLALGACSEDAIDIAPVENNTTAQFYSSELEIKQAVMGTYARLGRNGTNTDFPTEYFWLASENRADVLYLATQGTTAQNDQLDLRKYLTTDQTGMVQTIFARLYMVIKEANNLLANTKEGEYLRYRAEAKFLRAYAYSELARSFGPVALFDYPIERQAAIALPRAPLADVYKQVIADLEYAATNLDKVYTGAEAGRVGSLAANALLGQVYMTMGGYPLNDNSAYAKAETVFASIIGDVATRFAPNYGDIFTLANENKYDLFSVQFASGNLGLGSSLPGYITNSSSSGTPYPEWAYSSYNLQGQDIRVDKTLMDDMTARNDLRLAASVDFGYWNSLDVSKRTWVERTIVTKFLEKDKTNSTIKAWNDYPRNFPILRVADVYLLYAEALVRNGKAADAKAYVDKIRLRAGIGELAADPTLEDILYERKCEFIGEGRRFFDLVRMGETYAIDALTAFSTQYHSGFNGNFPSKRDLLLPIPLAEMKTRNNWDNNFGY
ncbi:MAG: RagB/SusD family nutrient uptake outer membrane protein [Marinilabiliaceae bacterium]|nr:RagB/SusD family nutrient uptake outer membrane protein [Marinilabiliaceae bacterium]